MEDMEGLKFWKGMSVLVTGATGVIGTNLVNRLIRYNAEVTAVVRDWVPRSRMLGPWVTGESPVVVVRGQLEDFIFIERVIAEYETEYIFHLGAQTIVNVGNASPVTTFKANIEGSWNLLEAARIVEQYDPRIKAICVASSDKAYGESKILPYNEGMPLAGQHPYDVSKSCTDLIAQSYAKTYSLPVLIARMGNIYGPGDLNFNRIIPGAIKNILSNEPPLIRSDGTPIREYFFVEDAVDAYLTMAMKAGSVQRGEAFNFSSGEKNRVIDIVRRILSLMDSDLDPIIAKTSRNEIHDQYLSIEKAQRVLSWNPRYSLDKGLPITVDWYRKVLS
jgi:CDP-glucose 4,6-dehydratase